MLSGPGRPLVEYDSHGNVTQYSRSGGAADVSITYDDYDHATVIDDGTTKTEEWLTPSGRVLHRKVTLLSNSTVTESVVFGYSDGGDSPAWVQPAAGGTTTAYVGAATVVGTTVTVGVTNLHGAVIGTVTVAGGFTDLPDTDEFGVTDGTVPGTRLGWLGGPKRFTAAPALGIVRMGVRLYDPNLGRFLEADPIKGGCANDYVYVRGNPISQFDLTGRSTGSCIEALGRLLNEAFAHKGAIQRYYRGHLYGDGHAGHITAFRNSQRALGRRVRNVKQECQKGRRKGPPGALAEAAAFYVRVLHPWASPHLPYPGEFDTYTPGHKSLRREIAETP